MCALAGRGATARARNSARSPVVNPLQHGAGGVVHHDVAPRQYPPRDLEEPVPAHAGAARATPGEWGDVLGRPHVVEDVRAGADHGPGAEQRAEQLQTGLETRPRDLETHATVCVLQVRRDRAGAEVRPAADHAMADEAVVRLVRVPQEDAARQLAARVRSRADRRRAHRSAQHVGVRADPQGPLQPGPGAHLGAAFEYDRTVPYIEDDARFHGGVAQRNRGGIAEHGAPRGERVTVAEQGAKVVWEQLLPDDLRALLGDSDPLPPGSAVLGDPAAIALRDAAVEPGVVFDVRNGPVVLESGAEVRAGARLEGPLWVGANARVLGGPVRGSAIGPHSNARGELSSCVFLGYANKAHDGFVGHSVIGRWV